MLEQLQDTNIPLTFNTSESKDSSDDDDDITMKSRKKKIEKLLGSDSESEHNETVDNEGTFNQNSDSENEEVNHVPKKAKKRIQNVSSSEDENESNDPLTEQDSTVKNTEPQLRMKNKRNKLKQKYNGLLKSRNTGIKTDSQANLENIISTKDEQSDSSSEKSSDDNSSIDNIKQKIKEKKKIVLDPSIYDSESSDEEKVTKEDSDKNKSGNVGDRPKQRMSAKEALENMDKIKSESNRMLREKDVSLPYHRPKALSLKDIMQRRRPALSNDGKVLPIKMNTEQLQQYAKLLEERQKEMLELCKSDTDEDEDHEEDTNEKVMSENTDEPAKPDDNETDEVHAKVDIAGDNDISKISDESFNFVCDIASKKNDIAEETDTVVDASMNEKENESIDSESPNDDVNTLNPENLKCNNEESQLITLHYDSEKNNPESEVNTEDQTNKSTECINNMSIDDIGDDNKDKEEIMHDTFSDDDDGFNLEDVDRIAAIVERVDSMADTTNNTIDPLQSIKAALSTNPKLTGAPGMVIDLNDQSRRLSGVELLKERFSYFAKLKTPEEKEREREKTIKPGMLLLKLKQELGDQIAEQRSLEWAKRLEEKNELETNNDDDPYDDIEKIEAKLDETEIDAQVSENNDTSESELEENDIEMHDKPKKKSGLIDDEAEESDCDDDEINEVDDGNNDDLDENNDDEVEADEESSEEESSSSDEDENITEEKPKKGRILKAFEDSDDEDTNKEENVSLSINKPIVSEETIVKDPIDLEKADESKADNIKSGHDGGEVFEGTQNSQDDELQSAQLQNTLSEDLFSSQECGLKHIPKESANAKKEIALENDKTTKLPIICDTQPYDENKFDDIAGMCSGTFSQNVTTQATEMTTQELGEDVLALCTGKFYDNEFIPLTGKEEKEKTETLNSEPKDDAPEKNLLQSILQELDDPEFDVPKPKFFTGSDKVSDDKVNANTQKKKFIIDSDDEETEKSNVDSNKKKRKKKKLEDRALQISDDEEEEYMDEDISDQAEESEIEDDADRIVEYDSEENEVEVQINKPEKKKKRKATDFFEQEAELTSEDEWAGSGDEDEAGLDRMEREEGDLETFNQGRLQRELGQIHMRDVMDQDKKEVRLLQELLLEDGDLGGGHRQRKFRWKNADGEDYSGSDPNALPDTLEEEFESEEQWRKERHEREVFLRSMMEKEKDENEPQNVSINRTAIIKANLTSKSMSALLLEVNSKKEKAASPVVPEKKTATSKDIPSPVKTPFTALQQYRGSLLCRGNGALARLGALAAPIAAENGQPANLAQRKGNFVFAAISPSQDEKPKTSKRKIEPVGTPQLIKKMKTDDQTHKNRHSLLEHIEL